MNMPSAVSESTKDLQALAALAAEPLQEAWFDEPANRRSSPPSSPPVSVGDFLGDPLADAWLR
jgi:hypothetical protein